MTCRVSFSFSLSAVHWSTDVSKLLSTLTQPCRSWWSFHSRSLHRPLWCVLKHAWLLGHCVSLIFMTLLVAESEFFQTTPFPPKCCAPKKAGLCEAHWSRTSLCWNHLGTGPISISSSEHCSGYVGKAMHPLMWAPTSFWFCSSEKMNEPCTELWYQHYQHIVAYRTAYLECKTQTY